MDRYVIEENRSAILMQNRFQNVPASRRVLIAARHDDRETALEIGREILYRWNCVILIPKEDALQGEKGDALLQGLHLAVFTVTAGFLGAEGAHCRALLKAAMETPGLRVLLIQAEKGVEQEFDRVCGPWQLLDRTAEGYFEKLKTYIEGYADPYVKIDTEEGKALRERLLSYRIFLSYRKKDAAFLQRILAAIRACPELSSAAVWFDDSLVSGEDYNEQIDRALLEADVVLFAVTDHFTEAGNYVLVNEYPRAAEEGKLMLPVLLEGTDESAIRRSFPLWEDLVPFGEKENWLEVLRKTGIALGKLGSSLSPDEMYLLACEYESGVRTAPSRTAVLELLRQAAQRGSPEAMEKLGDYTAAGNGGEQDREKAAELWRAAVFAYEARLEDETVPAMTRQGCAVAMNRLASDLFPYYFDAGRYEEAREMVRAQSVSREAALKNGAYLIPVSEYQNGALLCAAAGEYEEALALFDRMEKEIPKVEALDRPAGQGAPDTIHARSVVMRLTLFRSRGHIHTLLALRGEEEHFAPAVRDLFAAVEICRQFDTWEDLERYEQNGGKLLLQFVNDLLSLALQSEEKRDGMPEAQRIYEELCSHLDGLLRRGGTPELMNRYGLVLTNAAMAGRTLPDRDRLEQAYRIYDALCSRFLQEALYRQNRENTAGFLTLWPASADVLRQQGIRPDRGAWLPVQLDPADAGRIFTYPGLIPEGAWGDFADGFRVSAYRCPHCGQRLYKTVFPEGREPRLPVAPDGSRYVAPARVFGSPCGRFFASPQGMRLTEGVFLQAILVFNPEDQAAIEEFSRWWKNFGDLGDPFAQRRE